MTNSTTKRLQHNIRKLRLVKELTQEELSVKADITTDYLSEIERGKKCPSIDTIHNLSVALDVDVQELFNSI